MINTLDDIILAVDTVVDSIPQIPDATNFWMVRSKQGVFYNEYVAGGYIAIGWNSLTKDILSGNRDDDYYKQILKDNNYPDKMPGTALNKCRRFIEEIQSGDIAMIVGRSEIAFATIGDYFELESNTTTAEKELEIHTQIETGTYLGLNCPYKKRRHISIISKVDLSSAPPMVYKCMVSNRHSLSSLNEYADAILSCCYDLSVYSNRLIIKYHIRQPRDINPIDFSLFTISMADLIADNSHELTGKYNLNSEGDVIFFLSNFGQDILQFLKDHLVPILLGYFILFGGKAAGIEFPSSIEKIKELVADFLYRKETKRIKVAEADKAEAEAEKAKVDAERNRFELEELKRQTQERACQTVDNLTRAAVPLNIKPPANNIIDITALFQIDDETE